MKGTSSTVGMPTKIKRVKRPFHWTKKLQNEVEREKQEKWKLGLTIMREELENGTCWKAHIASKTQGDDLPSSWRATSAKMHSLPSPNVKSLGCDVYKEQGTGMKRRLQK